LFEKLQSEYRNDIFNTIEHINVKLNAGFLNKLNNLRFWWKFSQFNGTKNLMKIM